MRKQLKWDDYRQMAVAPHQRDSSGYQRPIQRYCHDYGKPKPEVVVTPNVKAALERLEVAFADGSAAAFAGRMAKAMGLKTMAPHEAWCNPVDMRETDSIDSF